MFYFISDNIYFIYFLHFLVKLFNKVSFVNISYCIN